MAKSPTPHELLHAAVAAQMGLITLEEAQNALQEQSDEKTWRQTVIDARRLTPSQDDLVAKMVDAFLAAQPDDARQCLTLLEQTPHLTSAVALLESERREATVSFDGSRTAGRRSGDAQEIKLRITPSGERFRPMKLHAAGGLGEVHLARDEQLKRDVALKQLQSKHADDPLKRERFVLEGEVTGALEHPGIVPVYALGVDVHGRPFYAMRFVRGESLRNATLHWHKSEAADVRYRRDALELRRLLARFISVCQAMEYAHSRGVIHRDLKPANIMLGKHGETYVVDWGLARVEGGASADPPLDGEGKLRPDQLSGFSGTLFGSVIGTPAYMSPEQASGASHSVGPRADVYSLGATLYHLLTGRPPHVVDDQSPGAFMKLVERGEYPAPRSIVPQLPRELDAICRRAMAVRPDDRYDSAEALALDIERWLADEPVVACPQRPVDRLARWGRKHRTAVVVGGAGLALLAIVASAAALVIENQRLREQQLRKEKELLAASEQRAHAEANRRFLKARQTVDEWLTGASEALAYYPGVQQFRTAMLERAAAEYEAFVAERGVDPALRLEQARTLLRLGDLRQSLSEPLAAIEAYQQALAAFAGLIPAGGPIDEATIGWANAQGHMALAHESLDDNAAAEQAFHAGIARLAPPIDGATQPIMPEAITALSALEINYGRFLLDLERFGEAQTQLAQGLARIRKQVAARPDSLIDRRNLAAGQLALGEALLRSGETTRAIDEMSAATQFYDAAAALNPDDPTALDNQAAARAHLASAFRLRGDDRAEAGQYAEIIAAYERLCAAQPDAMPFLEKLALVRLEQGQLFRETGEAEQAAAVFAAAKQEFLQLLARRVGDLTFNHEAAIAVDNLAEAYLTLAQPERALSEVQTAVKTFRALVAAAPDEPLYRERLAVALSHQGQILSRMGDAAADQSFAEAATLLDRLIAEYAATVSHRDAAAQTASRRGDALSAAGETAAAEAAFAAAAEHWQALVAQAPEPSYLDRAAWFFATCPSEDRRDLAAAAAAAERAVAQSPANGRMRATLALVNVRRGRFQAALEGLDLSPDAYGATHGKALLVQSLALQALGRDAEARTALEAGEAWLANHAPGDWELAMLRDECREKLGIAGAAASGTPEPGNAPEQANR
jgi:serine/threonine-protein kinase